MSMTTIAAIPLLSGVPLMAATLLQQVETSRQIEGRRPLAVHVVDETGEKPVVGATVTCVPVDAIRAEASRRWGALEEWFDDFELEEVSRTLGATRTTDERGEVSFERPDGELRVTARVADRDGRLVIAANAADAVATLRMEATRAIDFDVHVVDATGRPVGGIPVVIGGRGGDDTSMDTAWPAGFVGIVISREGDGIATIRGSDAWFARSDGPLRVATFAFPVAPRVEVRLDRASSREHRELVVPPLGRVVLTFAGVARGVAQLRNDALDEQDSRPFWRNREPARAAIVDGHATFPFVGVGTRLQYRATWEGLSAPVDGFLEGPRQLGETVEFTGPSTDSTPILRARIVDDDGRPFMTKELYVAVRLLDSNSFSGTGFRVTTDVDGRVSFTLDGDVPPGKQRQVGIGLVRDGDDAARRTPAATLDLPSPLGPGVHDLGELVLHMSGSRRHLRALPDAEVERLFTAARSGKPFTDDADHDADTCLSEMVERGGTRWEDFLRKLVEKRSERAVRRRGGEDPGVTDLGALIALRRVQREHEPIALEIEGAPRIETTFGEELLLRYRIRNVDTGHLTLGITTYELSKYGMNEYCRLELQRDGADAAERFDQQGFVGGGPGFDVTIPPGEAVESTLAPKYFVEPPLAGDYEARLYHGFGNSRFAMVDDPTNEWICAKSDGFTIRVLPRGIDLPKSERARLRGRFDAIDLTRPVLLLLGGSPSREDAEFEGPIVDPEDDLYRAGWRSVPVLLDVLEDARVTPRGRAWALALLHDITGRFRREHERDVDAFGRRKEMYDWPTVKLEPYRRRQNESRTSLEGPEEPNTVLQAELARRWLTIRGSLSIRE